MRAVKWLFRLVFGGTKTAAYPENTQQPSYEDSLLYLKLCIEQIYAQIDEKKAVLDALSQRCRQLLAEGNQEIAEKLCVYVVQAKNYICALYYEQNMVTNRLAQVEASHTQRDIIQAMANTRAELDDGDVEKMLDIYVQTRENEQLLARLADLADVPYAESVAEELAALKAAMGVVVAGGNYPSVRSHVENLPKINQAQEQRRATELVY